MNSNDSQPTDLKLLSIVWGVRDIHRAARFWSAALNYDVKFEEDDWAILKPAAGDGIQLSLMAVTSDKPHRHHIDLFTHDQAGEVKRLIGLGAREVPDWRYEDDADYIVLEDTEGNRFCVCQLPEG